MSNIYNDIYNENKLEFWQRMVDEGKIKPEELDYWLNKEDDEPSAEELE